MATQTAMANRPAQDTATAQQLQNLREIYADASELGRAALEKMMPELEVAAQLASKATINGRSETDEQPQRGPSVIRSKKLL